MISRGIRVQFLCFRMKQLECSREWSPHSPQIVGTERSAKILSGLSGTCHGICYSNTQGKVTARERQQEHLSNQGNNRLAQDHRAWNTGEIKLEKENILVLPQFPDMRRKPHTQKSAGASSDPELWGAEKSNKFQREQLKQEWGKHHWALHGEIFELTVSG